MNSKECEPDDPVEMIGVQLNGQSEAQLRDMALCFAEEFIRQGFNKEKLLQVFKNLFYQGPYLVFQQKGEDFVRSVINEALAMWHPRQQELTKEGNDESCL